MKVLAIVSSAYRAVLEEQDDTVVWLIQTLRKAGAEVDMLLRGPASNYVVAAEPAPPLTIGGKTQRNAPDVHRAVRDLAAGGARIFTLEEDIARYGLAATRRLQEAQTVATSALPQLMSGYDAVWHW